MIKFLTSESVTSGHPDKLCDLISDSILDECLKQDSASRVACEVLITSGLLVIAGEITTRAKPDYALIAKQVIKSVGYGTEGLEVLVKVNTQSPDIASSVDVSFEAREENVTDEYNLQGAGDQGMMYGFATNETPEFLPLSSLLASKLTQKLTELRQNGPLEGLLPDGKSQVSVVYLGDKPQYVSSVIVSTQHEEKVGLEEVRAKVLKYVVKPVLGEYLRDKTQVLINPSGRFVVGGFEGDTGITGRKIIVDTYGGVGRHGGGAFSGKDASKVDRSGAYMARYVAKNLIASGLCARCEVSIAYAIGKANPTSVNIDTFGTGVVSEEVLKGIVLEVFDLRPKAMIDHLRLKQPIFAQTAVGGHFTNKGLPWEQIDKVHEIKSAVSMMKMEGLKSV